MRFLFLVGSVLAIVGCESLREAASDPQFQAAIRDAVSVGASVGGSAASSAIAAETGSSQLGASAGSLIAALGALALNLLGSSLGSGGKS